MTVVVCHPTGNANSRALLRGLAEADLLEAFFTSIALPQGLVEQIPMPRRVRAELRRRVFAHVPYNRIRTSVPREALRILSRRLGWSRATAHETGVASIDRVNVMLARRTGAYLRQRRAPPSLVYAYEDAALETFEAAKERSLVRVLELPLTDWRTLHRILEEERDLVPAWAPTLDGLHDSTEKLARKDEEIDLADHIVVPCTFALRSLRKNVRTDAAVHLAPYGAPPAADRRPSERGVGQPLKVLYVGQIGQRKGVSYLLDAVGEVAAPAELTLIGPRADAPLPAVVDAALRAHRWMPPMPHAQVLEQMQQHHVMVFPSLCEGFGLVILEAMAQGVPVVTTMNTGGPDVIENGVDGFLVPIRDPMAIAERLTALYEDEPRRRAMAEAAKRKAAELNWEVYQRRMAELLRRLSG